MRCPRKILALSRRPLGQQWGALQPGEINLTSRATNITPTRHASVTTHGDVTIGRDKFDPPKGAPSPTDEQLARSPGQYRGKATISGGVVSQVVEDNNNPNRVLRSATMTIRRCWSRMSITIRQPHP
jgi:hypothetical protein